MNLWKTWISIVEQLESACSRNRTFLWMIIFLMAISIRCGDLSGVTSVIRVLGLMPSCYERILNFLHSPSLNVEHLTKLWVAIALENFTQKIIVNGKIVLLTDGIKVAKEGKKMPGVKALHQESDSNSKAEFIMGHSCQAIGILVQALGSFFCVPLICKICEGIVFSNRDKRTLYDKLLVMLNELDIKKQYYLVADAYYSVSKMVKGLKSNGNHLITRAKKNIVAYEVAPTSTKNKRGRPKKYGEKIKINALFKNTKLFESAKSTMYGDQNVSIEFYSVDLLWKACGEIVRFVLVKHPQRGKIILVTTDLNCDPLTVIKLYSLRFKIEVSFKQSLYTVGAFAYRFWMKSMKPIKRRDGNQYLHRESEQYKNSVKRKMETYHRFIQLSFIAQGILQYLSINMSKEVWCDFGSWIRTSRVNNPPSEMVVATALRNSIPAFFVTCSNDLILKKFLLNHIDTSRAEGKRMFA